MLSEKDYFVTNCKVKMTRNYLSSLITTPSYNIVLGRSFLVRAVDLTLWKAPSQAQKYTLNRPISGLRELECRQA